CEDHRSGQWTPPGRGPGQKGSEAIPLPSRMVKDPKQYQVLQYGRIRSNTALHQETGGTGPGPKRLAQDQGLGTGRRSFGGNPYQDRQSAIRQGEQDLWPFNPSQKTCGSSNRQYAI